MIRYTVSRLGWAVMLCVAASMITFVLFDLLPRQENTTTRRGINSQRIQRAQQFDGPVFAQYGRWVSGVVKGSMGHSDVSGRSVGRMLLEATPVTVALTLGGAVIWLLLAVPLGVLSAVWPRSTIDRTATVLVLVGLSTHPVWLGLILSYLLGYQLHILPVTGYCGFFSPVGRCGGPVQWFTHMLLPWFTFALVFAALYLRMIRASVTEVLQEEYVRFARAKGLSEWGVLRRHALPNALITVVPMAAMDISRFALPTALFVEPVFDLPGVGRVLRDALLRNDVPVVAGIVVVSAVLIVVLNFAGEIIQAFVDPRVKMQVAAVSV